MIIPGGACSLSLAPLSGTLAPVSGNSWRIPYKTVLLAVILTTFFPIQSIASLSQRNINGNRTQQQITETILLVAHLSEIFRSARGQGQIRCLQLYMHGPSSCEDER